MGRQYWRACLCHGDGAGAGPHPHHATHELRHNKTEENQGTIVKAAGFAGLAMSMSEKRLKG
jgi:hypothetical protein